MANIFGDLIILMFFAFQDLVMAIGLVNINSEIDVIINIISHRAEMNFNYLKQ